MFRFIPIGSCSRLTTGLAEGGIGEARERPIAQKSALRVQPKGASLDEKLKSQTEQNTREKKP
jgi:hypothetical protein